MYGELLISKVRNRVRLMHVCFDVCVTKKNTVFLMTCLMSPLGFYPYKYDGELVGSMKSPMNFFSVSLSPCRVFFSGIVKVK